MKTIRIFAVIAFLCIGWTSQAQKVVLYQSIERKVNHIKAEKNVTHLNIIVDVLKKSNKIEIVRLESSNKDSKKENTSDVINLYNGICSMHGDTLIVHYNENADSASDVFINITLESMPESFMTQDSVKAGIYLNDIAPELFVLAGRNSNIKIDVRKPLSFDDVVIIQQSGSRIHFPTLNIDRYFSLSAENATFIADRGYIGKNVQTNIRLNDCTATHNGFDIESMFAVKESKPLTNRLNDMVYDNNFVNILNFRGIDFGYFWGDGNEAYGIPLSFNFIYDYVLSFNLSKRFSLGFGVGAGCNIMASLFGWEAIQEVYYYYPEYNIPPEYAGIMVDKRNLYTLQPRLRIPLMLRYYYTSQGYYSKAIDFSLVPSFALFQVDYNRSLVSEEKIIKGDLESTYKNKGKHNVIQLDAVLGIDLSSSFGLYITWGFLSAYKTAAYNNMHRHTIGFRWVL